MISGEYVGYALSPGENPVQPLSLGAADGIQMSDVQEDHTQVVAKIQDVVTGLARHREEIHIIRRNSQAPGIIRLCWFQAFLIISTLYFMISGGRQDRNHAPIFRDQRFLQRIKE